MNKNNKIIIFVTLVTLLLFIGAMKPPADKATTEGLKSAPMGFYLGYLHEIGLVNLHMTNWGSVGLGPYKRYYPEYSSCEYPAGSGIEHLYGAGIWIGAITPKGDTLVSTAQYDEEFNPDFNGPGTENAYYVKDPQSLVNSANLITPYLLKSTRNVDDDTDWVAGLDDVGEDGLENPKEPGYDPFIIQIRMVMIMMQ